LGIKCVHDSSIMELMRGLRNQLHNLIAGISDSDINAMSLGLSHSLSRYKLKFTPDKVDTMIVQAISLLDDLDKELNTYAMRSREWYGWHFPELTKVIPDNIMYAKVIKKMGSRNNAANTDFTDILPSELEEELKEAAQISMGTEISTEDVDNILDLCNQVISISEYREQLFDYLKNRMQAIAPNLTILVGELVGARLISHAGSLLNLAKHPASTVQILGAEKALFRALKTRHQTPKYGLIYHASLIGQTPPKFKGKISRVLAAKAALATRYDALGEAEHPTTNVGIEGRARVEQRMKNLEPNKITGTNKTKIEKYDKQSRVQMGQTSGYNASSDSTLGKSTPLMETQDVNEMKIEKKKKKKQKQEKEAEPMKETNMDIPEEEVDGGTKKRKERYFDGEQTIDVPKKAKTEKNGEKKKKKKKE